MTTDEIPQEILGLLNLRAGKIHKRSGVVVNVLAEIPTEHDRLLAEGLVR